MAQGYGLDAHAAPIVGAANTIMQGLNSWQNMQDNKADREWMQWQRRQEKEQVEAENKAQEIAEMAMFGGREGGGQRSEVGSQKEGRNQQESGTAPRAKGQSPGRAGLTPSPAPSGAQQQPGRQTPGKSAYAQAGPAGTGLSAPQPQQQGRYAGPESDQDGISELLQNTPGFNQPGGLLKNVDTSKYSPKELSMAREKIMDWQIKNLRYSNEGMKHLKAKAEMHRQQGQEVVSQAIMAARNGDHQAAAQLATRAYNEHMPNGQVASIGPDGSVQARNFVTGKQGRLNIDATDPQQVEQTIEDMAGYFQNPETFLNDYYTNSETQLQYKVDALKNAKAMMNKNGDVVYRVDLPNSEAGTIDTLLFDHMPTFDSDPLQGREKEKALSEYKPLEYWETQQKGKPKMEVKDYHYDIDSQGNPVTRGFMTKKGDYVPFDSPVPGFMGETPDTPKSKTGPEARKAQLDEFKKKLDAHKKSMDLLLDPFNQSGGTTMKVSSDGLSFTDSGSQALTSARQMAETAREKPEEERTQQEQQAIQAVQLYNQIASDVYKEYNKGENLSQPPGLRPQRPEFQAPSNRPGEEQGFGLRLPTGTQNLPVLDNQTRKGSSQTWRDFS